MSTERVIEIAIIFIIFAFGAGFYCGAVTEHKAMTRVEAAR